MTIELEYADNVFCDCQVAIEELCIGCPDERGWSFATDERPYGEVCEYMTRDVSGCEKAIVMEHEGRPFCYMRYLRYVVPDYEKYLKRMRGDWS